MNVHIMKHGGQELPVTHMHWCMHACMSM